MRNAGLGQASNQLQLSIKLDRALLILQAISWTNFDYSYVVRETAPGGAESATRGAGERTAETHLKAHLGLSRCYRQ
jgi:hypothetical protein